MLAETLSGWGCGQGLRTDDVRERNQAAPVWKATSEKQTWGVSWTTGSQGARI